MPNYYGMDIQEHLQILINSPAILLWRVLKGQNVMDEKSQIQK